MTLAATDALARQPGAGLLDRMRRVLTRRAMLGTLLAGVAAPALSSAPARSIRPMPRGATVRPASIPGVEELVSKAGLGGEVGFAVADLRTGELLEARAPTVAMPPASVAKSVTALYALDVLGPAHRFSTELIATGPVAGGRIEGDLILAGRGDPTLDSDGLADLAASLKDAGVREITGRLRVWAGALPTLRDIDSGQPPHVGYNPALSGLNLNYNRVHFEWKRSGKSYDITMEARAKRFSPAVGIARMDIADRTGPVYEYLNSNGVDRWSVARGALGNGGSRWLPVRRPDAYALDVFATIARSYGVVLKPGDPLMTPPVGTVLARHESADLRTLMRDMLRYSTNLTAETAGLTASAAIGPLPDSLRASATRMNIWAQSRYGAGDAALVDHSGLGYGSAIPAADMVRLLVEAERTGTLRPILRDFGLSTSGGDRVPASHVSVAAKTGTLNFVSALAGYARTGEGRDLAFAIFTADTERRDAIPVMARERPEGARGWAGRSRRLQQDLILRWANVYSA